MMARLELAPEEAAEYAVVRREMLDRLRLGNQVGEQPGHRRVPPPPRPRDPAALAPATVRFAEAVSEAFQPWSVVTVAAAAEVGGVGYWTARQLIRELKDVRSWPYHDAASRADAGKAVAS